MICLVTRGPSLLVNLVVKLIVNLIVNLVVNTLSCKRRDAKRHYVILAKALDGMWPVGHACAAGASAQHCTGMTNWPNTILCLG